MKVTDKDGAYDTKSTTVDVGTGAFLPPLANQPVADKLKNGQVLPVKIHLTDCSGAGVNNLTPAIRLVKGDKTPPTENTTDLIEPVSVSSADTSGVMRRHGQRRLHLQHARRPAEGRPRCGVHHCDLPVWADNPASSWGMSSSR